MSSADVVIVGGGVIGASIAYHLSLRGAGKVIVLERDRLGLGSTGKNAGGIRLQFSTEVNVRVGMLSRRMLERFDQPISAVEQDFQQLVAELPVADRVAEILDRKNQERVPLIERGLERLELGGRGSCG